MGLLIISVSMLIAVGGLVLVQHLVPIELRKRHNDVAGFIYAVVGVIYAVLLGLMVIAVWGEWEEARNTAHDEANELAEVFWLAHQLPQPEGRHIQELARSYARVVVDKEWPLMEQGKASQQAWDILDELRGSIMRFEPTTAAQQVLYEQEIERVHALADARRDRLVDAEEGIPTILWIVLIVGGSVAVGFTYLFGLDDSTTHTLMVAALALVISLVLFTVAALDYPFKGDVRVGPDAFELVLSGFQSSNFSDL